MQKKSGHGEVLTVRINKGDPDGEDLIKGDLARRSQASSLKATGRSWIGGPRNF